MKDPSDDIRDWVYSSLNGKVYYGGVAVPVYSVVPNGTSMPYIVIGEQSSSGEDSSKDSFVSEHDVTIEIYSSHTGNRGSYTSVNSIASSILQLLRTMAATSGYGRDEGGVSIGTTFNVIKVNMRGLATDRFTSDDKLIIYKSLNINLLLEEL